MRAITLFAVISIFTLNRWYQVFYNPQDDINFVYWWAKDFSGELKCFVFALVAMMNACSPKVNLREKYIYLLMVFSAFFEVIDVGLCALIALQDGGIIDIKIIEYLINLSWRQEFFYRFLSITDGILFIFGFNYMITREYDFQSDTLTDKGIYFVFRQPSDPRSLLYGLFGKPISGLSIIYNGVWYRYNTETRVAEKRKIKFIPEGYVAKKMSYKPSPAKLKALNKTLGYPWSPWRNMIKNNCILLRREFLKECGIELRKRDFYPPFFANRFL